MSILFWAFIISHGLNVIGSILIMIPLIRLYYRTGISLVNIMIMLFGVWGITNLLLIIPNVLEIQILPIALANIIGSAFAPALFLLFADRFEGRVSPLKTSVAVSMILLSIFVVIVSLWTGILDIATVVLIIESESLITMRWAEIPSLFLFPGILLTGYWVRQELKSTGEHAIDERQIEQIKWMQRGNSLTFFIGPIFGAIGVILVSLDNPMAGTWASEIIGYLIVSAGVFIFGINYLLSPEVAFLQPQRVDTLLVLHETGVPVLRYDFRPPEIEADTALVSGAITAITAIMNEAFGVKSMVRSIHFEDKELMLQFADGLAFVLIADRTSIFLESSLKRLKEEFELNFIEKYDFGGGEILDQAIFLPAILKSFGLKS
ncbi:MAG: hypothetical protein D6732_28165 [Methanobacteriota archaeon]|nr:MAG: hypothetical protein D6732_28165 [Euryarchaeota archaeon]